MRTLLPLAHIEWGNKRKGINTKPPAFPRTQTNWREISNQCIPQIQRSIRDHGIRLRRGQHMAPLTGARVCVPAASADIHDRDQTYGSAVKPRSDGRCRRHSRYSPREASVARPSAQTRTRNLQAESTVCVARSIRRGNGNSDYNSDCVLFRNHNERAPHRSARRSRQRGCARHHQTHQIGLPV